MIGRKIVKAVSVTQSNDTTCFNGYSNDMKGSVHNKRAKRHASKRGRQFLAWLLRVELHE